MTGHVGTISISDKVDIVVRCLENTPDSFRQPCCYYDTSGGLRLCHKHGNLLGFLGGYGFLGHVENEVLLRRLINKGIINGDELVFTMDSRAEEIIKRINDNRLNDQFSTLNITTSTS